MKRISHTLLPLLLLASLVACQNPVSSNNDTSAIFPDITNLKAETKGHFTEPQFNYLSSENYEDTTPYNGNLSVSKPEPVSITWDSNVPGPFKVRLTNKDDNSVIEYQAEENHFEFYNPLFNKEYEVAVIKEDKAVKTTTFIEKPSVPGPRSLYIDGVENIRDIGGWGQFVNENEYVPYFKQGLLYRSGRFNEDKADEVKVSISEDGLYEIKNHLKIKTEIDLRRTSTNEVGSLSDKSVLGDDVNYIQLPMAYGGNNILTFKGKLSGDSYEYDNPAMIKRFFEILSDKNNYPVVFHCSIGKDRTGCLAFLVEGLVAGNWEMMYRDYMFTNFANAGMCKMTDITERYGKTLLEGYYYDNCVYEYLENEVGIEKVTLNKVISILTA